MFSYLRPAVVLMGVFTILTGLAYPLLISAAAQTLLSHRANGSMIVVDGKEVGSELIGQRFTSDRYFHGRPSSAGQDGYDAMASSGSNLGPTSKKLLDRIETDVLALKKNLSTSGTIPADAVTTSGSGLDPHITPAYADIQVERVARAVGMKPEKLRELVKQQIQSPVFGLIGEPRVNVLRLNQALDARLKAGSG